VLWRKVADRRQVVTTTIRWETWGVCECDGGSVVGRWGTVGHARKLARREQWSWVRWFESGLYDDVNVVVFAVELLA
jgi:hypothetical protein